MTDIEIATFKEIYGRLGDEIYKNRMLYSFTGEVEYVQNVVKTISEGKVYEDFKSNVPKYIWGAGLWGKMCKNRGNISVT